MGNVRIVGPNEALVLSGNLSKTAIRRIVTGGWLWKSVATTHYLKIPLNLMTLYPECESVETREGVQVNVSGAAHVKVKRELINLAAEHWGGKSRESVRAAMEATIGGHLRSILSSLTVEEAYKNRLKFAELVREEAEPDLTQMGFTIVSFVILDLQDNVGYFHSLGRKVIADVKRDAAVAEAEANRDACRREFECDAAARNAQFENEEKIEENRKNFELALYGCQREMQTARAEVDLAYSLSAAKLSQEIMWNNKETDVIERRKRVENENIEIERKTLELECNQKLPADAESYRIETLGEAMKNVKILMDRGDREGRKIAGVSRQTARLEIGRALAEKQLLRAEVYKKHGVTAVVSQVLETLPKIAATISLPLSNIEEITMIDEDALTAIAAAYEHLHPGHGNPPPK